MHHSEHPDELSPCARNKGHELLTLACTPHVHQMSREWVKSTLMKLQFLSFLGSRNPIPTTMMFRLDPLGTTGRGNTTPGWVARRPAAGGNFTTLPTAPGGGSARVSPPLASPEPRQAHPTANAGCAPRGSACEVQILSSGRETKRIGRRSQCRGHLILLRIADHSETRQIDGKKRGASTVDFGARIHCRSSLQRDGS